MPLTPAELTRETIPETSAKIWDCKRRGFRSNRPYL
jgi:hypothetical protein